MPDYDFLSRLYRSLKWPLEYIPNARETNIIRHYIRETERGHMTDNTAIERCSGDIMGWNYHPTKSYGGIIKGE